MTRLTQALPGASVTIGAVTPPSAPLAPGGTAQFSVPVQISGNGQYFDQTATTTVNVQNTPVQPFTPGLLFYDDDPEHVSQDGVLFRGSVTAAQPARIYYYHDNTADPRRLVVALESNGTKPRVGAADPRLGGPQHRRDDRRTSGYERFLLTKNQQEGIVVNLSGDQPYLLTDLTMTSRQLVAGSADIRVLSGGPVEVTVMGVSPGVDPRTLLAGPVLPGDGHHRTGTFSIAGLGRIISVAVGNDDATVVLGDTDPTPPNVTPSAGGHDYGDYGIVHTIAVTLENPTAAPAAAYLYVQPLAGPARGSFLVHGNPVNIGCVRVPSRYQVTAFDLAARSVNARRADDDRRRFVLSGSPWRYRDRSGAERAADQRAGRVLPQAAASREPMNADGESKVILLVRLLNAIDQGRHSFEALKEKIGEGGHATEHAQPAPLSRDPYQRRLSARISIALRTSTGSPKVTASSGSTSVTASSSAWSRCGRWVRASAARSARRSTASRKRSSEARAAARARA